MTPLKIVPLRDAPLLNDLPGQLRAAADRIEQGEIGPFETLMLVGVSPTEFKPYFCCWGVNPDRHIVAGVFTHCAHLALVDNT